MHKYFYYQPLAIPSAKDIFSQEDSFKLKPFNQTASSLGSMEEPMVDEGEDVQRRNREENRELLKVITKKLASNEVIRCENRNMSVETIENDKEDFIEIKDIFQNNTTKNSNKDDVTMIDTSSSSPGDIEQHYFDVKRLLIQERGEDEYFFLLQRKSKQLQDQLDDELTRLELALTYEHFYQTREESRLEFQRQIQLKLQ